MKGISIGAWVLTACGIAGCATPILVPTHDASGRVDAEEVEEVDFCTEYPWSTTCLAKKIHSA